MMADAARVDGEVLHRPVARVVHVVDLGAAVVDLLVQLAAVADAAAVLRADDHVTLPQKLAQDMRVASTRCRPCTPP
jgi:hypothetical protein